MHIAGLNGPYLENLRPRSPNAGENPRFQFLFRPEISAAALRPQSLSVGENRVLPFRKALGLKLEERRALLPEVYDRDDSAAAQIVGRRPQRRDVPLLAQICAHLSAVGGVFLDRFKRGCAVAAHTVEDIVLIITGSRRRFGKAVPPAHIKSAREKVDERTFPAVEEIAVHAEFHPLRGRHQINSLHSARERDELRSLSIFTADVVFHDFGGNPLRDSSALLAEIRLIGAPADIRSPCVEPFERADIFVGGDFVRERIFQKIARHLRPHQFRTESLRLLPLHLTHCFIERFDEPSVLPCAEFKRLLEKPSAGPHARRPVLRRIGGIDRSELCKLRQTPLAETSLAEKLIRLPVDHVALAVGIARFKAGNDIILEI